MKRYLEEDGELDELGNKQIVRVKEVKDQDEAKALKKKEKSYFHKCYHDEDKPRPCKREVL